MRTAVRFSLSQIMLKIVLDSEAHFWYIKIIDQCI